MVARDAKDSIVDLFAYLRNKTGLNLPGDISIGNYLLHRRGSRELPSLLHSLLIAKLGFIQQM